MLRALSVVLFFSLCASATVIGVDYGAEFIKIAGPKGNASIDIVLNEQTRRKSNNYVGFRGDDRFLGEDAKNMAARFPDNMLPMTQKLVGVAYDSPERLSFTDELHHTVKLTESKHGTVSVSLTNPSIEYTAEEVTAMIMGYIKDMSEKDCGTKISDAVIVIPSFLSMHQRQSLITSGKLAGLRIIGFMHSTTATALQYGIQRRGFGNETHHITIVDVGSTKTEVGVYTISPPVHPETGRIKIAVSMGTITTRFIASDPSLGGKTFDSCIAKILEDEYVEKTKLPRVLGGSTHQQHKASFSLMRAASSARETLSVNTDTPVTVEGIAPDRDFQTRLSRETFETKCSHLLDRITKVTQAALDGAGLKAEEMTSFEMVGGGVRSPKILADLSSLINRPVDRTLNGDESAAFGAAYYAARISGAFRVKSFALSDFIQGNITFALNGSTHQRPLYTNGVIGSRKSITVRRTDDFSLDYFFNGELIGSTEISGVHGALEELKYFEPKIEHENNTFAVRVGIRLAETGILKVEEAEVRVRYAANISKRVKVVDNSTDNEKGNETTPEVPAESITNNDTITENETVVDVNATETEGNAEVLKKKKPRYVTKYELQMKKRSSLITATFTLKNPSLMDETDFVASKAVISAIEKSEQLKRDTATVKNDLETYLQWVKWDGILDNSTFLESLEEGEEKAIREQLEIVAEWLDDGEGSYDSCTMEEFLDKMQTLKAFIAPINERVNPSPKTNTTVPNATNNTPVPEPVATENDGKSEDETVESEEGTGTKSEL